MNQRASIHKALQSFAAAVKAKSTQLTAGEPEEQLRGPFDNFIAAFAKALGWNVECVGETLMANRIGRPDFAIHLNKLLNGYVELKAPGIGAVATRFKGRNREQFDRFSAIPNLLYTDGNEWAVYRDGELVGDVVRLNDDVISKGANAATIEDAFAVERLLRDYFAWQPIVPTDRKGRIDLQRLAALLAPLCRLLRDDVKDAVSDTTSPLVELADEWRELLFPDASNDQFADAYAQTVTFALLLGRSEGASPLTLESAEAALAAQHSLLSRALQVLTDPRAREEIDASLSLLMRVIAVVPPKALTGPNDPWLYFYEDFLAAYDPQLRKDAGAYYTPVEVVRAQVRLIDDLLVNRLGKPLGFADSGVVTLDPAVGTGTYLLGVIERSLSRIEAEQGKGAVAGQATTLANNLFGFEIMVGPYSVTELRVSRALRDRGATLPADGTHVFLTDTLESPHAVPAKLPLYLRPIAEQHAKALQVKNHVPVIVCLGNPPYDRHEAATAENKTRTGNWVRWGDDEEGGNAILRAFIDPAVKAGHGGHVKNLYNLYVYFWRWALWKVFEHESSRGPGIVSFITASSYIDGDAFCGMREHLRRLCDDVWVIDLGGEGRGTRKTDNVFAIQTPVAIAVALRSKKPMPNVPAKVHYAVVEGTREAKLAALDAVAGLSSIEWLDCPDEWQAPFRPAGKGDYFASPLLTDLMPWQHSGAQVKRTWPICPDADTLERRWKALLGSTDRAKAFKETRDRTLTSKVSGLLNESESETPLAKLPAGAPSPRPTRYAYRSFDRQWILADSRLGDFLRPDLWRAHGARQTYLTSLLTKFLGMGPAVTACSSVPDLDHFSGRGAKDVIPLYRRADASEANILPGLLNLLASQYGRQVSPEDFLAYVYGVLAQPAFTALFTKELETRELRVPLTKDAALFESVRANGAHLLWLHTYGERFPATNQQRGAVVRGHAKCTVPVSGKATEYPDSFAFSEATGTLSVGNGEFAPVSAEVFEFEVSGLKVVRSWLKYRMKVSSGRKSSPLDDIRPEKWTSQFTTELLELLWVLEATVGSYSDQARLLDAVVAGECFAAIEMPPVPADMRLPPKAAKVSHEQLGLGEFGE